jgi:hypothetical protein
MFYNEYCILYPMHTKNCKNMPIHVVVVGNALINHFDPPSAAKEFIEILINWYIKTSCIQIIRREYV